MRRLLSLIKNKYFSLIFASVILIIVIMVSTLNTDSFTNISNILSVPLSPLQKLLSSSGQKVDSFFTTFKEIKTLKEENETLKIRVNELEKENRELNSYRDKIVELRLALNLKAQFDDYEIIGANVIAKEPGNWFNVFKIDIGSKDGVDVDYPVISSTKGLVGRIISADSTSSKVVSIIDEDSVISGWILKSGGGHVMLKGDLTLKEQGLCRMYYIPIDVDVAVDDVVETSGLGGIYPKGILVGKVREVRKVTNELDRYAIIDPEVDLKRLEEVFVLKRKNDNEKTGNSRGK
ncbi:MAG TPA: rod shape-determining protein MreC [Clostridiales bacterium]|nr:rod shape-determining protein MreC [Clostridiales bacterium]